MGALSKLFFDPIYRLISACFSQFLPQVFRFMLISAFMLYHSYQCKNSRNEYMALINSNSSKFMYGKKCSSVSPAELECSICLVEYEEGDAVRQLRCSHGFHCKCLDQWLHTSQATCPICRTFVVPENIARERKIAAADHRAVQNGLKQEIGLILLPVRNAWSYPFNWVVSDRVSCS